MRLRHEAEIHSLSEQLKLEPEFIKVRRTLLLIYLLLYLYLHLQRIYLFNIIKECYKTSKRACPRKKRKISAYNVFQIDWWEKKKSDGI